MLCVASTDDTVSSPSTVGLQVWAAEGVARSILRFTDLSSLDSVLNAIQATPELHGYLKDSGLWNELQQLHFGGNRDSNLPLEALTSRHRSWDWTSRARTCLELQQFLRSIDEKKHFDETVTVVKGDIGTFDKIDGVPLDGIVFPTNPQLTNHHVGAAAAMFHRAGPSLSEFVADPSFRGLRPVGSAVATPAFDAGVQKIIHCVGPSISMDDCYELLDTTYKNALTAMLNENLSVVALASVSTGNLGVPNKPAAQVALRAIQKFLRSTNWQGKLAIVCYEWSALQAFTDEKVNVLKEFNAVPPLPTNERDDSWILQIGGLRLR